MAADVEVKSRKSKPDLNSVHLSFPHHMRQLPIAAPRQKGGVPWKGAGGGKSTGADKTDSKRGADKTPEPQLIRVTIDGGRESEEELCRQIHEAARQFTLRRAHLHSRLGKLLELRQTVFDSSNTQHTQQLTHLWELAMGDESPAPPTNNMPSSPSNAGNFGADSPQSDWGDLGFQNRFCPQSDFRDMGMLSGQSRPRLATSQPPQDFSLHD